MILQNNERYFYYRDKDDMSSYLIPGGTLVDFIMERESNHLLRIFISSGSGYSFSYIFRWNKIQGELFRGTHIRVGDVYPLKGGGKNIDSIGSDKEIK